METGAKKLLFERLDENLQRLANEYMDPRDKNGQPFIENIYCLQAFTETHIYLKTEHEFTPGEVNDLLMFADPLTVAHTCWEENTDKYCLRISELIDRLDLRGRYPPAALDLPAGDKTPSLRERLEAAKQEVGRNLPQRAPDKGSRGADAR